MVLKQILILGLTLVPFAISDCIDLSPFASNPDELSSLTKGGNVPDNTPIFFDIPADFVDGEVVYCLENVTIPKYVGLNECQDAQQCFLAVGMHAGYDNDASDTDTCTNSDGDTSGCYECACTGSSMRSGIEKSLSNGCGLSTDSRWGMSCSDVTNGRFNWVGDQRVPSNYSTVHVSICPEVHSDCSVCQGGLHPSFQVGVQWISNLEEQCFNDPFGDYECSVGLQISSIIGISVGSALLLAAFVGASYYFYSYRRKTSCETPTQNAVGSTKNSPPLEEISCSTEAGN